MLKNMLKWRRYEIILELLSYQISFDDISIKNILEAKLINKLPCYSHSYNLDVYKQHKRLEDRPVSNEDLLIPFEKWLVALSKRDLSKGNLILREFYAQGYFEAYDIVMTYAEKTNSEVVWFKEKRNCGYPESNINFLGLEHFCTYCNRKFSNREPIPCLKENCFSHFCSDKCFQDHIHLRKHDH